MIFSILFFFAESLFPQYNRDDIFDRKNWWEIYIINVYTYWCIGLSIFHNVMLIRVSISFIHFCRNVESKNYSHLCTSVGTIIAGLIALWHIWVNYVTEKSACLCLQKVLFCLSNSKKKSFFFYFNSLTCIHF